MGLKMIPTRLVNICKYFKSPISPNRFLSTISSRKPPERSRDSLWRLTSSKCIERAGVSSFLTERTLTLLSSPATQMTDSGISSPLLSRIKLAKNVDTVFSTVSSHEEGMSDEELYQLFIVIENLSRKEGLSGKAKHGHPGFVQLCKEIKTKSSSLSSKILHSAVYFMCKHGTETEVTRSAAESLKEPLLKLNWKGIHHSLVCLEKAKNPAPFTLYMKDYLRKGLEAKLLAVLESKERLDEIEALLSACLFDLPELIQRKLITLVVERHRNLTVVEARNVLISLAKLKKWNLNAHEIVLLWNHAMATLTSKMSKMEPQMFATICYLWSDNLWRKKRSPLPLPDELCAEAAQRAANEKWPWKICATLASTFAKKGFVHGEFLEYCVEQEMATGRQVVGLRVLGDLNYKPRQFENYFKFCVKNLVEESNLQYLYRLLSCAVFGFYPLPLIKKLFGNSSLIESWLKDPEKYLDELRLLERLYQGVRVECPRYRGPFPPAEVSTLIRNDLEKVFLRSSIENYLVKAAGGPSYVACRVYPKQGFHIGHLLVRNTSGSLVPFNNLFDGRQHDLEAFEIPRNYQRIAVQLCQNRAFLSDGKNLRGHKLLEKRVLEKLGFTVINVNVTEFSRMSDSEKTSFLIKEIGLNDQPVVDD